VDQPKVLIACPTWIGEAYALKQWAAAYHAQTYASKGALQVDNSDGPVQGGNLHYTHLIRGWDIPAIWQHTRFPFIWDTFEIAWTEYILPYAHEGGYDYIFSVEADVIIPPDGTQKMVDAAREHSERTGSPAYVTQRYHPRAQDGPNFWWDTLGCSLFPVEPLYKDRYIVRALYELEVFTTLKRNGWVRYRPGHNGYPDLFIPVHLRDPEDKWRHAHGSTPADVAYKERVMRSNGLNLDGSPLKRTLKKTAKQQAKGAAA
jgi:hypothetical protein